LNKDPQAIRKEFTHNALEAISKAFAPGTENARKKIAAKLLARMSEVVAYVQLCTSASVYEENSQDSLYEIIQDQNLNVRRGTEQVIYWINSGSLPDPNLLEDLSSVGRRVANVTGSIARVVRANLAWRDILQEIISQEAKALDCDPEIRAGLLTGIFVSCDANLVRTARHFDSQNKEIEKELADKKSQLEFLALHDPLTGLANRALLFDRLQLAIRKLTRKSADQGVGIIFIDLDNFKQVNDKFGHALGDILMQTIAWRVSSVIRNEDTAARLGGDEFVVLCENLNSPTLVSELAGRIFETICDPIELGIELYSPSASIGVFFTADRLIKADALINKADELMYIAKSKGRRRIETAA
jgi:diguanylate cyclase (GGDEF)-like protein